MPATAQDELGLYGPDSPYPHRELLPAEQFTKWKKSSVTLTTAYALCVDMDCQDLVMARHEV